MELSVSSCFDTRCHFSMLLSLCYHLLSRRFWALASSYASGEAWIWRNLLQMRELGSSPLSPSSRSWGKCPMGWKWDYWIGGSVGACSCGHMISEAVECRSYTPRTCGQMDSDPSSSSMACWLCSAMLHRDVAWGGCPWAPGKMELKGHVDFPGTFRSPTVSSWDWLKGPERFWVCSVAHVWVTLSKFINLAKSQIPYARAKHYSCAYSPPI